MNCTVKVSKGLMLADISTQSSLRCMLSCMNNNTYATLIVTGTGESNILSTG